MSAIRRTAALAALAAAGVVVGLLALSHTASGTIAAPPVPLTVRTSFDPQGVFFGDRVEATIAVEIDRQRARAQTLRVRYSLAPLQRIAPPRTVSVTRGDVELVTITVPFSCISDACLAASGVAQIRLAPVRVSIATAVGLRRTSAAWPSLAVRDRVRAADLRASEPPLEADASPLPPTYSVSPAALATVLDVVAALLGVAAIAIAAWELERLAARRRAAPDGPVARAIRLARSAQALGVPERRRALERLARVLGRGDLRSEASRLAWSQPPPDPDELELLVEAVEREETT